MVFQWQIPFNVMQLILKVQSLKKNQLEARRQKQTGAELEKND